MQTEKNPMANKQPFSNSTYAAETDRAERELSAFISAVTELFGPEQARVSTEDWLDELTLIARPSRSKERKWRAVTIAATARLASRLSAATGFQVHSSTDTKSSPIHRLIVPVRHFGCDAFETSDSIHVRIQKLL